jgi:hypothetical protein
VYMHMPYQARMSHSNCIKDVNKKTCTVNNRDLLCKSSAIIHRPPPTPNVDIQAQLCPIPLIRVLYCS